MPLFRYKGQEGDPDNRNTVSRIPSLGRKKTAAFAASVAIMSAAPVVINETQPNKISLDPVPTETDDQNSIRPVDNHYVDTVRQGDSMESIAERIADNTHGEAQVTAEQLQPHLQEAHTPNQPGIVEDGILQEGERVEAYVPTQPNNR